MVALVAETQLDAVMEGISVTQTKADNQLADVGKVAAAEWGSYIEPLLPLGEKLVGRMQDPDDPHLRREMYRLLMSGVSMGYFGLFHGGDPRYPDYWPNLNMAYNWGNPNPDDCYYGLSLEGKGVYLISGFRGTVRIIDFQIGGGEFYPRGGPPGPAYAHYDVDSLKIAENGWFEVVLSATRPEGHEGNWWELHPDATYALVRQRSYDWLNEIDGRLAIERIDLPAMRPRTSEEQLEIDLHQIPVWAENWTTFMIDMVDRYREMGLVNNFALFDYGDEGGLLGAKQQYVGGIFELEEGEALIYETDVPDQARFWNITVNDPNWSAIDYVNRQSHFNGHTATIDTDGRFRAVISPVDPGVPNWLDTGGYLDGVVFGRWMECSSFPEPEARKVRLDEVRKFLPADTATVSKQERDAAVRLRRRSHQMRKRW